MVWLSRGRGCVPPFLRENHHSSALYARDHIRNAFDDVFKRPFHRFPWHRSVLQRYKNGQLSVHGCALLLFRSSRIGVCWECSWADLLNNNGASTKITANENWKSMLVTVYEQPERIIPSTVRLNTFNLVDDSCGKVVPLNSLTMISYKVVLPEDNREGNLILSGRRSDQGSAGVFGCEFPRDVMKSAAQVAENVANDSAEVRVRLSGDAPSRDDQPCHMNTFSTLSP